MLDTIRKSGVEVVGDVPWGTHFCQFYQSRQDLVDTLVPYIRTGLADNEFCMWVTSEPLAAQEAEQALRRAVPGLDRYLASHQLEILSYREWYLEGGSFDARKVLDGWVSKLEQAQARGYEGLRLTGNTFWLEKDGWADFTAYEEAINGVVGKYPMIALCTYALDRCGASEVIDVVNNHQFALIKRDGRWRLIENSEYKRAAEERERLLEIEQAAHAQAERQAAQMSALLANLGEGVLVLDAAGRIVLRNQAAYEIGGWSTEQIQARLDGQGSLWLRPDGTPLPREEWPTVRALGGERFTDYEVTLACADGSRRRVLSSGTAVQDEAGQSSLAITVYRDVTELRELERLREEFVGLISHDLRNPLTAVIGHADLLNRFLVRQGLDRQTQATEAILKGARRMNSMIQDLAESVRFESGQLALSREPTDLPSLVADLIERVGTAEDRARIRIERVGEVGAALADPARIERAITNLLGNALKYSPPESPVTIQVHQGDGEVVVAVSDRGVGILQEDLRYVFERFFRARTGKQSEGLGLGLYIARLIVEAHGGRIWAESKVGVGSTFGLALPVAEGPR